ncbi:MAG: TIGR03086 family metal-binding protein [Acidimicrobiales bacterium]
MSSTDRPIADRYRDIAAGFTARVEAVPPDAWSNPAPPDGWDARDVVRHLTEWVPGLLATGAGVVVPEGPSVDDDPAGAWANLDRALQATLDDPSVHERRFSHPQAGDHPLDQAIGMFVMGDVLLHTWDLAHATGQDETLDADEVAAMYEGMLPLDEMLRQSGQYGPRVDVPDDADTQTKLIAFIGRQP